MGADHCQRGRSQDHRRREDKTRKAYHDFLAVWIDADPDIPVVKRVNGWTTRSCVAAGQWLSWQLINVVAGRVL